MCFSWASSTCSLPSLLRARCAKMSRIRLVRSTTRQPSACSRLRCCTPESGWSKITSSADVSRLRRPDLLDLALAGEGRRVGPLALAGDAADDLGTRRRREGRELVHAVVDVAVAQVELDQECAAAALGTIEHVSVPAQSALARGAASHQPSVSPAGAWWGIVTGRDGTTVEIACL